MAEVMERDREWGPLNDLMTMSGDHPRSHEDGNGTWNHTMISWSQEGTTQRSHGQYEEQPNNLTRVVMEPG